jgi:hypothetical protein
MGPTRYCALEPAVVTPKKMLPLGVVLSTRTSLPGNTRGDEVNKDCNKYDCDFTLHHMRA